MPTTPQPIDESKVAAWLTKQFGGTWMHWVGGPAGIPDAQLWAQFQPDPDGKRVMVGMLLLTDGITSHGLRKISVGTLELAAHEAGGGGERQLEADLAKLPPLQRGNLSAPEFSQVVADHYRVWAKHRSRPAAEMVKASGEKGPTVHGWIREARLRGLLPEAERGKRARS